MNKTRGMSYMNGSKGTQASRESGRAKPKEIQERKIKEWKQRNKLTYMN